MRKYRLGESKISAKRLLQYIHPNMHPIHWQAALNLETTAISDTDK